MYEVIISREAEKYYKRSDKITKRRINKSVSNISKEPFSGLHIKRLHGKLEGKYRYAVADLRMVYEVDKRERTVKITAIRRRGDVYKK